MKEVQEVSVIGLVELNRGIGGSVKYNDILILKETREENRLTKVDEDVTKLVKKTVMEKQTVDGKEVEVEVEKEVEETETVQVEKIVKTKVTVTGIKGFVKRGNHTIAEGAKNGAAISTKYLTEEAKDKLSKFGKPEKFAKIHAHGNDVKVNFVGINKPSPTPAENPKQRKEFEAEQARMKAQKAKREKDAQPKKDS